MAGSSRMIGDRCEEKGPFFIHALRYAPPSPSRRKFSFKPFPCALKDLTDAGCGQEESIGQLAGRRSSLAGRQNLPVPLLMAARFPTCPSPGRDPEEPPLKMGLEGAQKILR